MNSQYHQGQALPIGAPNHIQAKPAGTKWTPLLVVLVIGLGIWFTPAPEGLPQDAWHLFALFVATIAAIILKPLPMGAVALIAMGITAATKTLPVEEVFTGFSNPQIWLIVIACFIARGFIKTGLANRIAYQFLILFGKSSYGLAYGFLASDLVMAPVIPSSTARAGGVLMPIIRSLSSTLGSNADDGTAHRIGAFLSLATYQATIVTSTMFVTAMAPNPIIVRLAQDGGVEISWLLWAKAAIVPGLLSLAVIPLVTGWLCPPTLKDVSEASRHARENLAQLGKMTRQEWAMAACFVMLLVLWIGGSSIGINATIAAILGVAFLLITNVLTWKDIIGEEVAWDTLVWFAVLVMMAANLNALGFIGWLSDHIVQQVQGFHWMLALGVLGLLYYYSHYLFASITAHVTSMYAAFMMVCIAVGGPSLLVALVLAFLSGLMGGLTHYSSGQAPVIFAYRYVDLKQWWLVGFVLSVVYLLIWGVVGGLWWSWLGIW